MPAVYANAQRMPRESSLKPHVVGFRLHSGRSVPVLISSGLVDTALLYLSNKGSAAFVVIVVASRGPMYEVFILPRIAVYILSVPDLRKLAAQSGIQTFSP